MGKSLIIYSLSIFNLILQLNFVSDWKCFVSAISKDKFNLINNNNDIELDHEESNPHSFVGVNVSAAGGGSPNSQTRTPDKLSDDEHKELKKKIEERLRDNNMFIFKDFKTYTSYTNAPYQSNNPFSKKFNQLKDKFHHMHIFDIGTSSFKAYARFERYGFGTSDLIGTKDLRDLLKNTTHDSYFWEDLKGTEQELSGQGEEEEDETERQRQEKEKRDRERKDRIGRDGSEKPPRGAGQGGSKETEQERIDRQREELKKRKEEEKRKKEEEERQKNEEEDERIRKEEEQKRIREEKDEEKKKQLQRDADAKERERKKKETERKKKLKAEKDEEEKRQEQERKKQEKIQQEQERARREQERARQEQERTRQKQDELRQRQEEEEKYGEGGTGEQLPRSPRRKDPPPPPPSHSKPVVPQRSGEDDRSPRQSDPFPPPPPPESPRGSDGEGYGTDGGEGSGNDGGGGSGSDRGSGQEEDPKPEDEEEEEEDETGQQDNLNQHAADLKKEKEELQKEKKKLKADYARMKTIGQDQINEQANIKVPNNVPKPVDFKQITYDEVKKYNFDKAKKPKEAKDAELPQFGYDCETLNNHGIEVKLCNAVIKATDSTKFVSIMIYKLPTAHTKTCTNEISKTYSLLANSHSKFDYFFLNDNQIAAAGLNSEGGKFDFLGVFSFPAGYLLPLPLYLTLHEPRHPSVVLKLVVGYTRLWTMLYPLTHDFKLMLDLSDFACIGAGCQGGIVFWNVAKTCYPPKPTKELIKEYSPVAACHYENNNSTEAEKNVKYSLEWNYKMGLSRILLAAPDAIPFADVLKASMLGKKCTMSQAELNHEFIVRFRMVAIAIDYDVPIGLPIEDVIRDMLQYLVSESSPDHNPKALMDIFRLVVVNTEGYINLSFSKMFTHAEWKPKKNK